ncbi:MAG: TraB/GumN family protein [Dehalococcoidia bacterium]|nr:MAG: TraB/GumN family protein [Dehalococcoidia bacterium]
MIKIIRKIGFFLLICFVLAISCSPATETDTQTKSFTKSFLWEVSSDVNTIYILGSVHVAEANIYPLNDVIEDAYDQSAIIVAEIDITNISEEELGMLLMEKGMYPAGESLETHISSELYSRVSERILELDPTGFLLSYANVFEPWVVAVTITDFDYMQLGYDAEYGIDLYFLEKANTDGKQVLEFESAEFQLGLFDSLSDEIQIMMLEDAIDNPVTKAEMEDLFTAWNTGDASTMELLVFEGIEEHPEYQRLYNKIIDDRNFLMVEKIETYLQGNVIHFVVVGAGHLVGDNGIINLLDEKGYDTLQL